MVELDHGKSWIPFLPSGSKNAITCMYTHLWIPITHRFCHDHGLGLEVLSLHGERGWKSPHPTDLFHSCTGVSRSHSSTYPQVHVQVSSPGFGKQSLYLWEPPTGTEWNHPRAWVFYYDGGGPAKNISSVSHWRFSSIESRWNNGIILNVHFQVVSIFKKVQFSWY